jgi:Tol biopolymer transport system component
VRPIASIFLLAVFIPVCGCGKEPAGGSRQNYHRAGGFAVTTPSLAPDGSAVVYDSAETGNGDVYRTSRSGDSIVQLTTDASVELHPIFSPDGQKIAFAKQEDGYQRLWWMDLSGSNQVRLTVGRVIDYPISFSPDGSALYFRRTTFSGRALLPRHLIFELSLRSSTPFQCTLLGEADTVSADGSRLAMAAFDREKNISELWVMDRDGSNKRHLGIGSSACLSADGSLVAFLRQDENFMGHVLVMKTDGTGERELPTVAGYKTAPVFCLRDSALVYRIPASDRDGDGGLFIVSIEDGRGKRIGNISGGEMR